MGVETPDHYRTLGVDRDATGEDIRRAYRALIRRHHPDVAGPGSADLAAELGVAYGVLADGDRRRAYDVDLSSPARGDVAGEGFADAWGEEVSWADPVEGTVVPDVVIDHPAGQPPAPAPAPAPGPAARWARWMFWRAATPTAGDSTGTRSWPHVGPYPPAEFVRPGARWRQVLMLGVPLLLLAGVPAAVAGGYDTVVVPLVLGGLVGVLLGRRSTRRRMSRPRVMQTVAAVLGVLLVLWLFSEQSPTSRAVNLGVVAFWVGVVWMQLVSAQRALNAIVPLASLKEHNLFGRLPGGIATDALNQDLAVFYDMPAMRMVRIEQPGYPFSHLLIVGHRAAFVGAVRAPGGHYRWSGPSLLLEQPGAYPHEVLAGPFAQAASEVRARLGAGVQLQAWLVVYPAAGDRTLVTARRDPSSPGIVGAVNGVREVGEYLVAGGDVVDHQVLVDALGALYR